MDDFRRATWVSLIKQKSDCVDIVTHFLTFVEKQFNACVRMIRTDNAKELCEGTIKKLYLSK